MKIKISEITKKSITVLWDAVDGADSDANYSEPQGISLYVDRTPPTAPTLGIDPEDLGDYGDGGDGYYDYSCDDYSITYTARG